MRALLAIAIACLALPAAADAGYTRIVNRENGWCLEGNQAGDVYVNPCAAGNSGQIWERWDGGWTRNVATGLCLKADGKLTPDSIHGAPCVWAEPRLNWLHWYGGWYERAAFDASAAECLSRLSGSEHDVTGIACANPSGPNPPAEEWYAVEATLPAPPASPPPPPPNPCVPAVAAQGLKLRVGFRHSRRVALAPYGARRRVHGRLLTADGKPVPGVGFCVGAQRSERGPVRPVGLVVSDAHGRFGYTIGRGPSGAAGSYTAPGARPRRAASCCGCVRLCAWARRAAPAQRAVARPARAPGRGAAAQPAGRDPGLAGRPLGNEGHPADRPRGPFPLGLPLRRARSASAQYRFRARVVSPAGLALLDRRLARRRRPRQRLASPSPG